MSRVMYFVNKVLREFPLCVAGCTTIKCVKLPGWVEVVLPVTFVVIVIIVIVAMPVLFSLRGKPSRVLKSDSNCFFCAACFSQRHRV